MTIANILTVSRILIVVPFIVTFYIPTEWASWIGVGLYWLACLTDYFDGMVARKKNQISNLGKFLDPIADKLLIATALIMLAGTDRLSGLSLIPALIILSRELFISGLREHLSHNHTQIPVSFLAKWKTASQMVSLSLLVASRPLYTSDWIHTAGILMLWISAFFSVVTGYQYWIKSVKKI